MYRIEKMQARVIDDKVIAKERKKEFEISRISRFRYRTRYFADSGIIGSKEFVAENYQRFKHLFYSKHEKKPKPTEKNMQSILLEIPEEIASQIKLPPKRAKMMLMEELVLRLYEQGIITSAHGASLLKKDRVSFERFLAEHEIAFHGDPDELDSDLTNLEQAL